MKNRAPISQIHSAVNDFKTNFVCDKAVFQNPNKTNTEGLIHTPAFEDKDLSIFFENLRV